MQLKAISRLRNGASLRKIGRKLQFRYIFFAFFFGVSENIRNFAPML
jgi:hypothetical protein